MCFLLLPLYLTYIVIIQKKGPVRKMKRYFLRICIGLFLTTLIVSCKTNQQLSTLTAPQDGRYDSEFPDKSVSDKLSEISKSIKKIDCLAFYMTYVFPSGNNYTKRSFITDDIDELSVSSEITNETTAGTAAIIYYDTESLGLLTCAHIVDYPDTIFSWYDTEQSSLHSVSVKVRQQNYIAGLPVGGDIEVVVIDKKNDIALLRKELDPHTQRPEVFSYKSGNTKELEWGTFVYIMGYPLGKLMVTRAIVSDPEKSKSGAFLTDALYNRGISGSPVFALRDGVPNFEWIGMAKSSSAENFLYLQPDKKSLGVVNSEHPYNGDSYVQQKLDINYGVTFSVTIEAISDFIRKNRETIENAGILVENILP
jgi:S1-C subfamily serine protease